MEKEVMKKINNRYIHACLAGLFVMLLYLALLCLCRITPFGEKTWIMYDLKRQYVDFYSYYKSIISGENNIFYSFSTALGSGILGFAVYYLSNPLFLIFCLFGAEQFPMAVSLIIGITLVLAAIIMDLFLQWYLGTYTDLSNGRCWIWLFSMAWSFSGFLIAHSMNMMWTDVVILLPIILYFLEMMLQKKRIVVGYISMLAAMLMLNYYITYQVLIFLGLWTLMKLWLVQSEKPFKTILRVAFATLMAVAIDAVLLLPTAFELANSPKDITKLGLEASGKNISPLDVFSKVYLFSYDANQPRFGLPQIYFGILLLFLFLLYFTMREINKREKIAFGVLFLVLIASFCVDYLNLFWHAGMEPSGHPYRQAPVCVFTMIICSARAFYTMHCTKAGIKIKSILIPMLILIGILMMLAIPGYEYVNKKMLLSNLLLIVMYAILVYMSSKKTKLHTGCLILMAVVLVAELLANAVFTYPYIAQKCENKSEYAAKITANKSVIEEIKIEDQSFYRMESLTPRQQNESMMYGFKGVTHYSSAGMTYVRYFLQKCGYNDDTLYTHYGHDNTVTMDSLLGMKYLVTEDNQIVHPAYKQYKTSDQGVVSYMNPYFAGVAFSVKLPGDSKAEWGDFEDIEPISNPKDITVNPFALQEDIVNRLVGEQMEIFKPADMTEYCPDEHTIEYVVTPSIEGELYMYIEGLDGLSQSMAIYKDDEFLTAYGNAACYKVLNLGYATNDSPITIKVSVEDDNPVFGEALFVTEDLSVIENASEYLRNRSLDVKQISSSHVQMTVPEAKGIWTSIPYEKGWQISLNGKHIEPTCIYGALMYIPTGEAGNLEMHFVPIGFRAGAAVSVIALLGFIILRRKILMNIDVKKRFSRKEAIQCTKDGILEVPEGVNILDVDFAYFVVREDLPKVHTLKIPKTVTRIDSMRGDWSAGPYGYRNNPFCRIVVDAENEHYASEDGVLFSKDKKELICYPCGKEGACYRVPEGVEIIKAEAFLNVEQLTTVLFPKSLQCVEERAFSACEQLDFPDIVGIYKKQDQYVVSIPLVTESHYHVDAEMSYFLFTEKEQSLESIEAEEFEQSYKKNMEEISNYEGRMELVKQFQAIAEDLDWRLEHDAFDEDLIRFKDVFYSEHM